MTEATLLEILLRGMLLLVGVAVAVLLLRRASAAHRHMLWTFGAAALLVLPAAHVALPALRVAVLPASAAPIAPSRPDARVADAVPYPSVPPHAPSLTTIAVAPERLAPAPDTALEQPVSSRADIAPTPFVSGGAVWLMLWTLGALFVARRTAAGLLAVRRLVRDAASVTDEHVLAVARGASERLGIRAAVPVLVHDGIDAPLTLGALRPMILLPRTALAWPAPRLRMALLHEMAHVARRDLLAEFLARTATALHWPNPLAWLAVTRMRAERERACDDLVLAGGDEAADYAGFLVSLARGACRSPAAAMAASMSDGPPLERRVRALLDATGRRGAPTRAVRAAFALGAVAALAACSMFRAVPEERSPGADGAAAPLPEPSVVVTVARDGSGDHTTIAAAVAAAPAGAVVRIGPGTYDERVVVAKPLTLEGAGPDATSLVADAQKAPGNGPTLRIDGVQGVVLRAMTVGLRGTFDPRTTGAGTVIELASASARIERVAIVGSPGNGVVVGPGSSAEIAECLVAGVAGTGIAIDGAARARISGCDVRNCRHRGITVGRGNRDVTIEGCRISGSSWHGVRYDDAAPVIRRNLIFANERSGIYASGSTEGRIEGNVFFENGMSDVSCWTASRDVIEANSFVRSKREAVAILGGAAPTIRRNVFLECATAILGSHVAEGSRYADLATLDGNLLWRNGTDVRKPPAAGGDFVAAPLPSGNLIGDPQFTDPATCDFSRRDVSVAARLDVGAPDPLPFASPWALRPEERATAPAETPAAAPRAATKPTQAPAPAATPAVARSDASATPAANPREALTRATADVLQIQDPDRRERGLVAIGEALRSADVAVARAALGMPYELRDVSYDKSRFRPDVLRLLGHEDATVVAPAAYALLHVTREPGDLDRVLDVAEKHAGSVSGLLFVALQLNERRADGRLGDLFVRALAVEGGRSAMDTANMLRGMWVSEAVEDAVIAAWRRPDTRQGEGLWPYIFGQMQPVREARARAIVEMLSKGDDSVRQLAGRAIVRAVDEAARPVVAQLAIDAIGTASTSALRRTFLDVVRANGTRAQVPALRALAANEMLAEDVRKLAASIADELDRRP